MKRGSIPTGRMKPCKHCGTLFYCQASQDVGGTLPEKIYCSRACYRGYMASEKAILDRFWANLVKGDGCWEYQTLNVEGYGIIAQGYGPRRKQYLAHRFAWKVYHGTLPPEDRAVCHHCDNPRCVRKEHLFLGTWNDNNQDKTRKRRHAFGERNSNAILTEAQVLEIRAKFRYLAPRRTNSDELAAEYGVPKQTIYNAAVGVTWRHLPVPNHCSAAQSEER
jgi:hypothetical protein